jgi:hypothetical protein
MPRLTSKQYLKHHKLLRHYWLNHQSVYSYLTPTQQWQLHKFFRPAEELGTDELLQHRKAITAAQPSLPHQVGRAISDLEAMRKTRVMSRAFTYSTVPKGSKTGKTHTVRVRSIVNSEIDMKRLAQVLIELSPSGSKYVDEKLLA